MNGSYPLLCNPSQQVLPNGKTLNPARNHLDPEIFPLNASFNNPLPPSNGCINLPTLNNNNFHINGINPKMNGGIKNGFLEHWVDKCCLPGGCVRVFEDSVFSPDGVKDGTSEGVRMGCDNPLCQESKWLHVDCFREWQNRQNFINKLPRRTRHFSDQNALPWMKRDFDHESRMNACRCGKGSLRHDATTNNNNDFNLIGSLITPPPSANQWERRFNFISPLASSSSPSSSSSSSAVALCQQLLNNTNNNNNRLSSPPFSSTTNANNNFYQHDNVFQQIFSNLQQQQQLPHFNPHVAGSTPGSIRKQRNSASSTANNKTFDFFPDKSKAAAGNIFSRRGDMTAFDALPHSARNSYSVRVEDEGPYGNDETRCFLLTLLSSSNKINVTCVVCRKDLVVYDKYPLINGTFFLSPGSYDDCGIDITNHGRRSYHNNNNIHNHNHNHNNNQQQQQFLNAVCMNCSNGKTTRVNCLACGQSWRGNSLVVGTMYNFDVFAAMTCCSARLACQRCGRPVREYPNKMAATNGVCQPSFSDFCRYLACPRCHFEAFHAIKSLSSIFLIGQPSTN